MQDKIALSDRFEEFGIIRLPGRLAQMRPLLLSDENWALGIEHWSDPPEPAFCQVIFARAL